MKGFTSTSSYTFIETYGSFFAQVSASSMDLNSATIMLPVKPSSPGSKESELGKGQLQAVVPHFEVLPIFLGEPCVPQVGVRGC